MTVEDRLDLKTARILLAFLGAGLLLKAAIYMGQGKWSDAWGAVIVVGIGWYYAFRSYSHEVNTTPVMGLSTVGLISSLIHIEGAEMKDDRLFLKVKLKSLAAEARIIRQLELKQLRPKLPPFVSKDASIEEKAQCVTERARVRQLRKDWKWGNGRYKELRDHRIWVVRREARATLLAYAYIRGKVYRDVEWPVWSPLDKALLTKAASMVVKYGDAEARKLKPEEALLLMQAWTQA